MGARGVFFTLHLGITGTYR